MTNSQRDKKHIFYLVMALIFTDTTLYGAIVPLIPVYTQQFQLTQTSLGIVFAAYSLGLLLFSIPLGIVAERYGYRKVFLAGMIVLTLSTLLYGFINSPLMLLLGRFIQGSAAAATFTAGLAMVALLYPNKQGEKLGLVMAAMGLGTIAGPPIGGFLYQYLGYREMFLMLASFCFLLVLMVWKMDFDHLAGSQGNQNKRFNIWEVKQNPGLMWLGVVVIICSGSIGMLEVLMPNYLHGRFALGSLQIGLIFGLMGIVHAVSDAVVGFLSDRHGFSIFIFWGLLASAIFLPFLALVPTVIMLALAMSLVGISIGAALMPTQPLMYQIVSNDNNLKQNGGAGLAYGLFNSCFSLGTMAGPILGGILDRYAGFLVSLIFYQVLFMFAAALFHYKVAGRDKGMQLSKQV